MPCTTILVGCKATNDGSVIISRNDDGRFEPKRVTVVPDRAEKQTYTSVLGHLTLELPGYAMQYTMTPNVNAERGLWPACGINRANVAMTATETITSNPRVLGADPLVEYRPKAGPDGEDLPGGLGEEDLVALVLPYICSAREGVLRTGELLEQYGTYESNGMAFADNREAWWLETIGGHHWIARKVPDDAVVIMPNQFGLDRFDFEDAYGKGEENLCSQDLYGFVKENKLYTGPEEAFNPRLAFGSRKDSDHIYNTPRAWYLARYFLERTYRFDGPMADYGPESNDIPWCFVPEHKVTVEDVRYLLGSHYQGTPYDPYDLRSPERGRYRVIGVPNSDVCGILQIRGNMPGPLQGIHWYSLGGSGFTACFPFYAAVSAMPDYIGKTEETVDTDRMYWQSRLIAALTDAHMNGVIHAERYYDAVFNKGRQLLCEYDRRVQGGEDYTILEEANQKIADMVKAESDKALKNLIDHASEHMKTRYHRGDN